VNRIEIASLLTSLAKAWPVGAKVRHVAGWTGEIAPAACDVGTVGATGAHAVLHRRLDGVIAVQWRLEDGQVATAWYRPHALRLAASPSPAVQRRPRPPRRQQ
jgi:hypothetical protein